MKWLLVFKIFIVSIWIVGMMGFIQEVVNNSKTFVELLSNPRIFLIFCIIFLGCVSIILNFIFKNKNILINYFLFSFFFCAFLLFIDFCIFYFKELPRYTSYTDSLGMICALYFLFCYVFSGFMVYGVLSLFKKNYKKVAICFIICIFYYYPFIALIGLAIIKIFVQK
ncbi:MULTISPECIES: hypothetical protein [Campylobacter]|uniref:Yip1 domain-containing protein n=1 Tax=Campylobacter taeniopygiae TaxID=2510188 RepID=A0ABY2TH75_9BACT|nr:hypothetical protein [Campylobacter taeniopygiae]MBZ7936422.1 hypothetical protein [Campylobacter sp. B0100352/1]TKX32861.1 hypothetical protein CQA75_08840 [Campylobacter taeniopygiae]